MGVLFENSIVCHVFYAIVGALAGPVLGLVGVLCFVFGFACACLLRLLLWLWWVGVGWAWEIVFSGIVLFGEFDPGSGRTLAACLTHASRTVKGLVLLVLDEWRTGE